MSKRNTAYLIAAAAAALLVAGCGERDQSLDARKKKVDAKAWEGNSTVFTARGWKAGDKTSWEDQLRHRAQTQNEYARDAAK
jgi:hypothetical protein